MLQDVAVSLLEWTRPIFCIALEGGLICLAVAYAIKAPKRGPILLIAAGLLGLITFFIFSPGFTCPNCQELCKEKYCASCGWEVGTETPKVLCPNCSEEIKDEQQFCGNCGAKMDLEV